MQHQQSSAWQTQEAQLLPEIQKIAVLRANALGDFLFTLPALEALRSAYPQAEIVLLAKAWHANFLKNRPAPIDRVIVLPSYPGVSTEPNGERDAANIEIFFEQMVQERFDIALQLHGGGGYSNPFIKRLRARMTAGLKAPEAEALDRWIPYVYFQPEIARYLEAVALIGATPVTINPRIEVTSADLAEAQRIVPTDQRPLIALHAGASDIRRRWSPAKFAAVGDSLAATGARIVVTGIATEQEAVSGVVQTMQADAQNLCGQLSLNGLTGLFARCQLVISNDTGPLHLAYAIGTPTIGIYWAYNTLTAGEMTRAHHRQMVTWRMHCPVCGQDNAWKRCVHQVSFVDDIQPDEVINVARELL